MTHTPRVSRKTAVMVFRIPDIHIQVSRITAKTAVNDSPAYERPVYKTVIPQIPVDRLL